VDDVTGHRPTARNVGTPAVHRVYVVEDQDHVRSLLVELLDAVADITVVGHTSSASASLDDIRRLRPDVAIIDGHLGGDSGLDVCRAVRREVPEVVCVILTSAAGNVQRRHEASSAGAVAYVVKEVREFDLVGVVRRVATGQRPIDDRRSLRRSDSASGEFQGAPGGHVARGQTDTTR
jgi:DNA-binding NarL/FixJ family response regulator